MRPYALLGVIRNKKKKTVDKVDDMFLVTTVGLFVGFVCIAVSSHPHMGMRFKNLTILVFFFLFFSSPKFCAL